MQPGFSEYEKVDETLNNAEESRLPTRSDAEVRDASELETADRTTVEVFELGDSEARRVKSSLNQTWERNSENTYYCSMFWIQQ